MSKAEAMRRTLLQRLGHQGWNRVSVRPFQGSRIVGEVWHLESTWSPQGVRAYLLFRPNDFDSTREQVGIYREPPETLFIYRYDGWLVRRRWRADLPAIFAELARIRDESMPEPPSSSVPPEPEARLQLLQKLSERQVRLFTCACLRRFQHIVKNQRNRQAIEAAEQYADGLIRKRDMKKSRKAACMPWLTSFDAYEEAASTMEAATLVLTTQQQMVLDDLLSDVAGNLDQKMTLRPSWLRRNGGIVARIAQTIYAEQSFADLPILADALEEAGCDNADILTHCRQPGEHARGCWVLDLLLGKK
jgi:hypothetical protein